MVKINVIILSYITIFLLFMFVLWQGIDTCHKEGMKSSQYLPMDRGSIDTCTIKLKQWQIRMDRTVAKIHNLQENIRKQEMQKQELQEKLKDAEGEIIRLRSLHTVGQQYSLYNVLYNDIVDMWYYIRAQLHKITLKMNNSNMSQVIERIIQQMKDRKQVLLSHVGKLISKGSQQFKANTMKELSATIQNRIHYLQNPKNCSSAKKLLCEANKECGFGCQLHHIVYCFIAAYATKRTFVLNSEKWSYSSEGWTGLFKPLIQTCSDSITSTPVIWERIINIEEVEVIKLPIIDYLPTDHKPFFLPPAVPDDIAAKLKDFHDNPFVWWVGQFVQYLLRTNSKFNRWIDTLKAEIQFSHPIAALHVRRSDKVSQKEAQHHDIDEYMHYVDEFYDQLQTNGVVIKTKKVYIATDDGGVFREAVKKYPHYVFIGNSTMATMSGNLDSRYSKGSLQGLIADIYFLSHADHVVGTFSSQVTRVAYELMHSLDPDADKKFNSLDDVYYFGGGDIHYNIAIYDHTAQDETELTLQKGDYVIVEGNHWNGYSLGRLNGSFESGLFPSYKVKHHIETANLT